MFGPDRNYWAIFHRYTSETTGTYNKWTESLKQAWTKQAIHVNVQDAMLFVPSILTFLLLTYGKYLFFYLYCQFLSFSVLPINWSSFSKVLQSFFWLIPED